MAPHVGIVGAGPAGLRCATVLLEHGFEVTIIEARDRIGGRVTQSDQMGDLKVDVGANWVHSTGENPIVKLAKETGTELHLWEETTLVVDENGNLIDDEEANDVLLRAWEVLPAAMEHARNNGESIDQTASLFDFFQDWCARAQTEGKMSARQAELVLRMSEMWGAYVGDRVERQSLKFFYLEGCINGDDCFIPSNYSKIMERIAARPLADAHIQYESVMTSVEHRAGEPHPICISTTKGQQAFDYAVITAPLGWLKKHKGSVVDLSPRIESAIDSMSFGRLEKVLIEFPTAFWDISQSRDPVSFVHWLTPKYALQSNPQQWRLECVSFNAFPAPYRRNILLFYLYGDCASFVTSNIAGLSGDKRNGWLRGFFEPYYSRLPGYTSACAPLRYLATEWCNDDFAGNGCYCNFQVGMTDAAHDVEVIRNGMPEKGIWFAGEHTSPFDGLGTVSGAYRAGEGIAHRIIEAGQPQS